MATRTGLSLTRACWCMAFRRGFFAAMYMARQAFGVITPKIGGHIYMRIMASNT